MGLRPAVSRCFYQIGVVAPHLDVLAVAVEHPVWSQFYESVWESILQMKQFLPEFTAKTFCPKTFWPKRFV
jgi:hypothetical protein